MRHPPGQALEKHTGQGVDVAGRADLGGVEQLRGHVGDRSHGRPGLGEVGVLGGMRDAEIDEIREVVRPDQDVLRFDVAVHEPLGVCGVERRGHLFDDRHRAFGREPHLLRQERA